MSSPAGLGERGAGGRTPARTPHLVVIDPQRIFADPSSEWASPVFAEAYAAIRRLAPRFAGRVTVTRWLPTADRSTAWGDYFRTWPFADVPADDPLYELVDGAAELSEAPPVDEPTFGKWGPALAERAGEDPHLVLTGVATDCCVISTALAAADAGVQVTVVSDACGHSTAENGRAALHIMGLYDPQIRVLTSEQLLAELG